jgi:hypothetical protein
MTAAATGEARELRCPQQPRAVYADRVRCVGDGAGAGEDLLGSIKVSFLKRLFGKGGSKPTAGVSANEEAVLVYLDGSDLPDHVGQEHDVATLEDRLTEIIEREQLGEFDGNEFGPDEVTLFMYGPNAERLFAGIEPVLRGYPLCQNARVVIRNGGPGAPEREVRL